MHFLSGGTREGGIAPSGVCLSWDSCREICARLPFIFVPFFVFCFVFALEGVILFGGFASLSRMNYHITRFLCGDIMLRSRIYLTGRIAYFRHSGVRRPQKMVPPPFTYRVYIYSPRDGIISSRHRPCTCRYSHPPPPKTPGYS